MSISFQGMGEQLISFAATSATAGKPVTVCAAGTVSDCAAGDLPAGVCRHVEGDFAAVQVSGFVTLPYTGAAPALGWQRMAADGSGGVRVAEFSAAFADSAVTLTQGGKAYLVVEADTTAGTVGFFL